MSASCALPDFRLESSHSGNNCRDRWRNGGRRRNWRNWRNRRDPRPIGQGGSGIRRDQNRIRQTLAGRTFRTAVQVFGPRCGILRRYRGADAAARGGGGVSGRPHRAAAGVNLCRGGGAGNPADGCALIEAGGLPGGAISRPRGGSNGPRRVCFALSCAADRVLRIKRTRQDESRDYRDAFSHAVCLS